MTILLAVGCGSDGYLAVSQAGAADAIDADLTQQIRPQATGQCVPVQAVYRQAVEDAHTHLVAQLFEVEEDTTIYILFDCSRSMNSKFNYARRLAAAYEG